ncbi:MAG: glycosyltransferase [Cyanobacteria bacterium]|nr:glycosyltransferase [Cyanobacteria bacterium bin.51]
MTAARFETSRDPVFERVLVIIPVRNEQDTLAGVIGQLQAIGLQHIRVVDNGSSDASAAVASAAGAELVREPEAGYGRACWRGLMQLPETIEWILFCDGDGSDDLASIAGWSPLLAGHDLILGNRAATAAGRRALTPVQRFGNRLATRLIRLGWGHRFHDLGPLRLVRRRSLEALGLRDRGFGWTIEMQVRAVEAGLRICEPPVPHHPRRGGRSKISGTVVGSLRAGAAILGTLGRLYGERRRRRLRHGAA